MRDALEMLLAGTVRIVSILVMLIVSTVHVWVPAGVIIWVVKMIVGTMC